MVGLDAEMGGGEVVDFADVQVSAEVDRGEHAGQLERVDGADHADVEEAVVHLGAGSDLHASAVGGSVGEGGEESGLGFFHLPFHCPRRRSARAIPVLL